MSEPDNLVLQLLRRIDQKMDRLDERLRFDLTARVSSLEDRCVSIEA